MFKRKPKEPPVPAPIVIRLQATHGSSPGTTVFIYLNIPPSKPALTDRPVIQLLNDLYSSGWIVADSPSESP